MVLYRSQKQKDLAYLIETRSAAYSLLHDDAAAERGWDYGCDFEVVERFTEPLTLSDMKADQALADWGALRAGFRRQVYEIPPDTWNHLVDRLSEVAVAPSDVARERPSATPSSATSRRSTPRISGRSAAMASRWSCVLSSTSAVAVVAPISSALTARRSGTSSSSSSAAS